MNGGGSRARALILERVARATRSRERHPHPGPLGTSPPADPVMMFVKCFTSHGGEVVKSDPDRSTSEWLTGFLRGLGDDRPGVAVGADVPARLRPRLPDVAAAHAAAGISMAWGAVGETGSLILPSSGTRAVQLLPPVHIVWVPADRIFARLEDALSALQRESPAAVGLHSGPSRSADIGRTVVTGVHGPGRCIAVLAGGDSG